MKLNTFSRALLLFLLVSQAVKGDEEFVVEDIQVKGLQRISVGTVYNYLPVNVGERFSLDNVAPAIKALFKTGFFKDISLEREGSTLIVNVVERPSIAKIIFEGNKDLSKDDLTKALKKIGLAEGKVFDQQVLDKVEQELSRQYFSHGKYGLKIKTDVSNLTRNRVGIHIKISEGRVAKIKQINIVGNNVFDDKTLLRNLELNTSNLLSFYTKDDQYSKQKLSADLETLRSYYLDRGYVNFNIESTQVAITPDKKDIYVTINVKEGDVYTLDKVKLAGNLVVDPPELIKLVKVGPEEIFSRKNATETSKAISDRLGDDGYAFANVNMVPEINEAKKTVDMTFFVDPGKRVYVRRINMKGNSKTRDEVLRREMRQMESSWASSSKIERSKTRLERLGYFEEVTVETPPVAGAADQIDVNYSVVEKPSGNLSAGVGFSQVQGIVLNANIAQDNVFGSGKRVNLAFNNSSYLTSYQFGFLNPYFTVDGVSQGYNVGYTKRNAGQINIANYSTNVANAGINFGIPLNEFDSLRFDIDVKHTSLSATSYSSNQICDFIYGNNGTDICANNSNGNVAGGANTRKKVKATGDSFLTLAPSVGWTHDTLNRAIFPNKGQQQRFSALATVPGSDLEYYKLTYKHQLYFPLAKDFTFRLQGEAAYGNGYGKTTALPFFENFFGGGTGSIRGFKNNTVGPRDSNGYAFGGSSKIIGNAELFFPVPFLPETKSVRLGTFMDAGSISDGFKTNNLKYSVGVSGEWMSPFGALSVSAALPLNAKSTTTAADGTITGDQKEMFQFNFGQNF
ncbi:outer membrane protein assembly factor BamA [Methylobacter sp. Wu8]|uniref:Outer membrane protein assembly factor BamA n=1 Tax=Methylobacter tundripaludum TaxID=173365 RepID=A0A2S6H6X0_9GAMM|nr:outer membrane protein assembly factor BamA [Methylobacter tundripaludum]MCF7964648.1 outer membrane protein assembly factor BamA [Methylobacter tundripaludum]MCK9635056.1 outer membrane protein assembly factor BamA [Methylobacter tundripaludum]PPK73146.1 Beta-barrel assembly machine subunit BamA [Methylobacter tundripaludum]